MQPDLVTPASSSLVLPLSEALQKSDSAQFALMLSLLFESRTQLPDRVSTQEESSPIPASYVQQPSFNMNHSLSQSLQSNSHAHFRLMSSLYHERSFQLLNSRPVSGQLSGHQDAGAMSERPDTVLTEINQSRRSLVA